MKKFLYILIIVLIAGAATYFFGARLLNNGQKSRAALDRGLIVSVVKVRPEVPKVGDNVTLYFKVYPKDIAKQIGMIAFPVSYKTDYLQYVSKSTDPADQVCNNLNQDIPIEPSEANDPNIVADSTGNSKFTFSKSSGSIMPVGDFCMGALVFKVLKEGKSNVEIITGVYNTTQVSEAYDSDGDPIVVVTHPDYPNSALVSTNAADYAVTPTITPVGDGDPPTATPIEDTPDDGPQVTPAPGDTQAPEPTDIVPITSIPDLVDIPGKISIYMKIRLQAVVQRPVGAFQKIRVGVALGGGGLVENTDYVYNDFISQGQGVYAGVVIFDETAVPAGGGYKIIIKGPKHLAKRICDEAQSSDGQPTLDYFCPTDNAGNIMLFSGVNEFDFTQVLLPAGDLPIGGRQDSIVDATDLTYISPNGGSTEPSALRVGDLNFDGVIDTQDYVIILSNQTQNEDEG